MGLDKKQVFEVVRALDLKIPAHVHLWNCLLQRATADSAELVKDVNSLIDSGEPILNAIIIQLVRKKFK